MKEPVKNKVIKEQPHLCKLCNGKVKGFRCEICGAESLKHQSSHECGRNHLVAKCVACGEAETLCGCDSLI